MNIFKSTESHKKYWKDRKIDWKTSYLDTWEHPHRKALIYILSKIPWVSLIEIGCGSGPNLKMIVQSLKGKQLGGIDINKDAVELAKETFKGGVFFQCSADNIMMSDKSSDVVLSDMALIYVDNLNIRKYLKEIKRVARKYVVLCEFHSENWFKRIWIKLKSGYNVYNWKKLLKSEDFYDLITYQLSDDEWPGSKGTYQEGLRYIIVAKVPIK